MKYSKGDWVIYVKPGNPWHLQLFQVDAPVITENGREYLVMFGPRGIIASDKELRPLSEMNDLLKEEHESSKNIR